MLDLGDYLLEVRTEEIPARMLPVGIKQLPDRIQKDLDKSGLTPAQFTTGFTPRRLVLRVEGLALREPDREEETLGPPVRVAFDAEGKPTKALEGFASRCGVSPDAVEQTATEKGDYLVVRRTVTGRETAQVLQEIVPRALRDLSWARTMKWGSGEGPWVRPVHSMISLLNGNEVPFDLFGITAGRSTIGHPILSPEPFEVSDAADYYGQLEKMHVIVSFEKRRETLDRRMKAIAEKAGGTLVEDDELLDKLAAICAVPGVVFGRFDRSYLDLPREVLIESLREHQSAFSLEVDGTLEAGFLTVMDRPDDPIGRIRSGNEWVVAARLEDGKFFHQEDLKKHLAEQARRLTALTFQKQLGSYAEKSERIAELSGWICDELQWDEVKEAALEAAFLIKADLVTEMVKEFTSLQGKVGGVYARNEGYPEEIWQAIYDQYRPQTTGDEIPRSRVGKVTALADRMDSLVGIFGLGQLPTGSKDPFGLRRAAQGALQILLEGDLPVDLTLLAARSVRLYGDRLSQGAEEILANLRPFLNDRVRHILNLRGYARDEIEAALAVGGSNLPDLEARTAALHAVRHEPAFLSVVHAAKRIANIVGDEPEYPLDETLYEEEAEKHLSEAFSRLRLEIEENAANREYEASLRRIADLAKDLDRFFVEVLVMAENPAIKANRIALLQSIHRSLSKSALLTEMVVDKSQAI